MGQFVGSLYGMRRLFIKTLLLNDVKTFSQAEFRVSLPQTRASGEERNMERLCGTSDEA
jgi:hypothetical protein